MEGSGLIAYLGLNEGGDYQLCVAAVGLNPIGTRLEKGRRVFPRVILDQVAEPGNGVLALSALRALQKFLDGEEIGTAPPAFGEELPLIRRGKEVSREE